MAKIDPAEAFSGGIKRPGIGFFYTVGLIGVTAVMAILPLIYIGLIGLVIYATYYHAVHHFGPIMGVRAGGRAVILKLFIYATPIFMGSVLAFFMVKPFFARRLNEHQPYALNPEAEPVLYEFIRRICEIVGAPMPSMIELDCNVNASAGFRHGFKSFFGSDLVLTIGLPLVAGLSARELAGIIAHEFGHFTQGLAMRLHYVIERIDHWFARLIWERDVWDEWLEEMAADEEGGWITFMAMFAQLGVWGSRLILKLLLLVGHFFSCYLSRRMEFNADQYEINLAGSAAFESASARVNTLCVLHAAGLKQMRVTWNLNKRLPDNLPQFMINMEGSQTGAQVKKAMKGELGFVRTGLFHTHPSDADRVRAARLSNAPGVVAIDAPARDLFENFEVPARIVTTLFYESIGLPLPMAKLYEVEQPRGSTGGSEPDAEEISRAAVDRYFSGIVTALRPIFPRRATVAEGQIREVLESIQALPAQINAVAEAVGEACAQFDRADQMMLAAAQEESGIAEGSDVDAWRAEREQARRSLHSVIEAYENRMASALALADMEAFGRTSKSAADVCRRVTAGLENLEAMRESLKLADWLRISVAGLLRTRDEAAAGARVREGVADIEAAMRNVRCPWALGEGGSLFEFFKALPVAQEPFLGPRAEALSGLVMAAYVKELGELALLAEEIVEQMNARKVMRVGVG